MLLKVLFSLEAKVLEVGAWLRLKQKEALSKLVKKNTTLVQSLNKQNKYLEALIDDNNTDIERTVLEINRLKDLLRKY